MGTQPPPEVSSTSAQSTHSAERVANSQQSSEHAGRGVIVAMVCPYDLSVVGGVQSHVFDVVVEMMKRGESVAVLAPVGDPAAIATRV
ncbi:MAG: hypothetical protein EB027_08300, partial [Actinobacteria bacterium]|nr:hypothetical protein [Actinomycetota bacterium]